MSQHPKPASPLIDDIPLFAGAVRSGATRLAEGLRAMAAHVEAGSVPNARYEDLRNSVFHRMADTWREGPPAALERVTRSGDDPDAPFTEGTLQRKARTVRHEIDFYSGEGIPGVRRLVAKVERAMAAEHPPEIAAALASAPAWLAELVAVTDAMSWLRERRVKRNAPGSAPPKPELPRATREAQELVKARMKEVTGDLRERFAAEVARMVVRKAGEFEEACAETAEALASWQGEGRAARAAGRRLSISEPNTLRMLRAKVDHLRIQVDTLVTHDSRTFATTRHPDGTARLEKFAREETERTFGLWTARNVAKLAPIVEARGGAGIKVLWATVASSGVETAMELGFPDGSGFTYTNGVEYAVSPLGKEFARFPARFHDVTMADGTRMKGPSEAKVKEAFGVPGEEPSPAPSR